MSLSTACDIGLSTRARPIPTLQRLLYDHQMPPLPWSTNQLKKLGFCIRDDTPIPEALPPYDEVMVFYNELAADTQTKIAGLDWASLLGDRIPEVTSRPKTIDTLRQKLQRDRSTPLSSVQDIAGVRFEAEMTLDEQDAVVNAIAGYFDHDLEACTRDLRADPHSGYRAVHLWLRLPGRVEVQIRTHLQGQWANTYEAVADVLGRGIRYNEVPQDDTGKRLVESLHKLSKDGIGTLEDRRVRIRRAFDLLDKLPLDPAEPRYVELQDLDAQLDEFEDSVKESLAGLKESFDNMRLTKKG
jgi:ppGpp synthetase/RelA/SpoT-type nucleotidyltranferase